MTSPIGRLWHHGQHSERQPGSARPAATVAYSRQPRGPQGRLAVAASPFPPEPVKPVQCGFCHVLGLSPEIPGIGGGQYRCSDIGACTKRWIDGAKAVPMPEPALPVLPKYQEEAMATFMAAHDEEDAREATPETCPAGPEPGMTPNPSAPGGSSTGHHTASNGRTEVSDRPGTSPATAEDAPEAEPGTEEEAGPVAEVGKTPGPALADLRTNETAEAPAPVAEDAPEPVSEPQQDDEGEQG